MLNFATITASLESTFESDADLSASGFLVERGDYVNMDPNRTPWLGIYRTDIDYTPRSLGRHSQSWEGTVTLKLLVQASHTQSGAACEDRLEGYIKNVLDAVWTDPTWTNVVDMVTAMKVEYSYKEDETASLYFQWAMITITAEVSTG